MWPHLLCCIQGLWLTPLGTGSFLALYMLFVTTEVHAMVFGKIKADPRARLGKSLEVSVCQDYVRMSTTLPSIPHSRVKIRLFKFSWERWSLINHKWPLCRPHSSERLKLTFRPTVAGTVLPAFLCGFWILIKIIKHTKFLKSRVIDSKTQEILIDYKRNCKSQSKLVLVIYKIIL